MELRIFEFQINGEREWVSAHTFIEAVKTHSNVTGIELTEYDYEDEIVEIPKDKWDEYKVTYPDDDQPEETFNEWVKRRNNAVDIIASTAY